MSEHCIYTPEQFETEASGMLDLRESESYSYKDVDQCLAYDDALKATLH